MPSMPIHEAATRRDELQYRLDQLHKVKVIIQDKYDGLDKNDLLNALEGERYLIQQIWRKYDDVLRSTTLEINID